MGKIIEPIRIAFYRWGRIWYGVRFTFWLLKKIVLSVIFALLLWDLIDLIGPPALKEAETKIRATYPFSALFKEDEAGREQQVRLARIKFRQATCRHIARSNYCPLCGKKLFF